MALCDRPTTFAKPAPKAAKPVQFPVSGAGERGFERDSHLAEPHLWFDMAWRSARSSIGRSRMAVMTALSRSLVKRSTKASTASIIEVACSGSRELKDRYRR